jgi:hypothetical protein
MSYSYYNQTAGRGNEKGVRATMKAGGSISQGKNPLIRRVLICSLLTLSICAIAVPRNSSAQFARIVAVPGNSLSMGYWVESPRICSVFPACGWSGCRVWVSIYGEHFQAGAKVELRRGSGVIKAQAVEVHYSRAIVCFFDLKGAAAGFWDVRVTNPDGGSYTLARGFQVIACGVNEQIPPGEPLPQDTGPPQGPELQKRPRE